MSKRSQKLTPEALITATQAADIIGVSLTWISRLVREGYISQAAPRRYRLIDVVQGYIRFLKDEERRTSKVQAEAGLKAARQREVELRIAEREGRLVEMEDVEAVFAEILTICKTELEGVPAAVTRDLTLRGKMEARMDAAFARASKRFIEAAKALRAGRDPLASAGR